MIAPEENPYAAPQTLDMTAPGAAWASISSPALRRTGIGLSLVYFGIVTVLLCAIMGALLMPLASSGTATMLLGFGLLAGGLLLLFGPFLCLSVPSESGAKGFILGSVVLQVVNIGIAIATQLNVITTALRPIGQWISVVSAILFVLFMRRLSKFIGRPDLVRRATNVLIVGVSLCLFAMVLAGATYRGATYGGPISGLLGLAVMLLGLIGFMMYANLVNALRKELYK